MVHTSYFNCVADNPTNSPVPLTFSTNFDNIILNSTSQHSMSIIGFSIPNLQTPLFTYGVGEFSVGRGLFSIGFVPVLDFGRGPGVVMSYANIVKAINQAFAATAVFAGSPFGPPVMYYDAPQRLFKIVQQAGDSTWSISRSLFNRFPTLPVSFINTQLDTVYAVLDFTYPANTCQQEVPALWSLNDYSRLIITAPGLPFDPTYSAVNQSGTPLSLRTLASFENNDPEFNRSSFVYSESGQGNWTLHDLKMSGNLQSIQLQVYAVNLKDEVIAIQLQPFQSAIVKLAFVRDS